MYFLLQNHLSLTGKYERISTYILYWTNLGPNEKQYYSWNLKKILSQQKINAWNSTREIEIVVFLCRGTHEIQVYKCILKKSNRHYQKLYICLKLRMKRFEVSSQRNLKLKIFKQFKNVNIRKKFRKGESCNPLD